MLYAIVALLVIILDQWTKFWVSGHIALNTGSRELIPGLLKLVNIHNDGAALGFLSGKNAGMLFIILCAVFTIFVIIALATKLVKAPIGRWSLLFIMAGGVSNCIDRLLSGYVQDMFMPTFMDKLPIFNVADAFITVFCLVFVLFVLFGGRRDDDYEDEDEDEEDEELEDDELDEEEEEDEDEEKPARNLGTLFGSKARRDEEEEDDEEDEDEEEKPHGLFSRLRSRKDEDDEEEDDEEEDDLPPARRPSRYDRAARNGHRPEKQSRKPSRDEEEDEDDEEEEDEDRPLSRRERREQAEKAAAPKKARTSRRDRQAELDEKYARFKAERAAREQQWSAEPQEQAPVVDPADPFAEWDKAAGKPAAPVVETPVVETPVVETPVAEPAPVQEAPAPAPAPGKAEEEEFSLEDILAEFR
ncbi:MAG: signal peptidase II [Oscillospiraceae bacterium]|nr:signal peptidase II [Oscillospiraceae bacterium]